MNVTFPQIFSRMTCQEHQDDNNFHLKLSICLVNTNKGEETSFTVLPRIILYVFMSVCRIINKIEALNYLLKTPDRSIVSF